jgi:hypothetical protein
MPQDLQRLHTVDQTGGWLRGVKVFAAVAIGIVVGKNRAILNAEPVVAPAGPQGPPSLLRSA